MDSPTSTPDAVEKMNHTCKIHHHNERVMDDNPEQRGGSYLKCTKCGHIKEEYGGHGGTVIARWGVEK